MSDEDASVARAALAVARARLSEVEHALRQAEAALRGEQSVVPLDPDEWPSVDIDLSDGTWVTPGEAAGIARKDESSIRRLVRRGGIAIRSGGRIWIKRERLFKALGRQK